MSGFVCLLSVCFVWCWFCQCCCIIGTDCVPKKGRIVLIFIRFWLLVWVHFLRFCRHRCPRLFVSHPLNIPFHSFSLYHLFFDFGERESPLSHLVFGFTFVSVFVFLCRYYFSLLAHFGRASFVSTFLLFCQSAFWLPAFLGFS